VEKFDEDFWWFHAMFEEFGSAPRIVSFDDLGNWIGLEAAYLAVLAVMRMRGVLYSREDFMRRRVVIIADADQLLAAVRVRGTLTVLGQEPQRAGANLVPPFFQARGRVQH
jgi:hypothetical protein